MEQVLHFVTENNRRIATAASIVLVVLMSLSIANTVLFVLDAMNPPSLTTTTSTTRATNTPTAGPKVSTLELFGKYQEVREVPQVVDAPETKLNLELQGVFIAEDEKLSTAIVAQKNKTGELYHIGDRLPGNATLAAVLEDHVLIKRGTRMEKLAFSDSPFRLASSSSRRTSNNATPTDGRGIASATPPGNARTQSELERIRERIRNRTQAANNSAASGGASVRDTVNQYVEKARNDPQGTLAELGISPVSNSESKGYRLGSQASQPALQQAGLQSGDVILSVNGQAVGNATNDAALVQQVMSSSRVRVEVQRGQRRFFLTVPVPK